MSLSSSCAGSGLTLGEAATMPWGQRDPGSKSHQLSPGLATPAEARAYFKSSAPSRPWGSKGAKPATSGV